MLFCSLLCSLSIRFNLKIPLPSQIHLHPFFIFAVWSTQMRNCQKPWFVLTSYRSLQSCMPLVHAGRAGRGEERRGKMKTEGKKEWLGRDKKEEMDYSASKYLQFLCVFVMINVLSAPEKLKQWMQQGECGWLLIAVGSSTQKNTH